MSLLHRLLGSIGIEAHLKRNLQAQREREKSLREFRNWEFLRRIAPRTILDVGANEGQFAKIARHFCRDAMIHSFEPLPSVFAELRRNLESMSPAKAHCFALGDSNEQTVIQANDFSPSSSLLNVGQLHVTELPHTATTNSVSIEVRRLDDLFQDVDLPQPIFIKIDVQGFEDRVLAGGLRLLDRSQAVVMEMSSYSLYEAQATFDGLYETMTQRGFVFRGTVDQWIAEDGRILQFDGLFERA